MLVSDDPALREDVDYSIPQGAELVTADDARQGFASAQAQTPSVVIVDLQCGSAGGFSLAHDMRDDPALTHVPIFLLLERSNDVWLAKQSGANAWATKPIDGHRLVRATLELLPR